MTDTPEKTELSIAPAKARRRTTTATTPAPTTTPTAPAPDRREDELQIVTSERDRLLMLLIEQMGGVAVYQAADLHFAQGCTIAQAAAFVGLPTTTTYKRAMRLYATLASGGLAPAAWRRQKAGRARKPRIEALRHGD
jgi:hypothetical protein